ncbi:phage T7 F exclusion suppressor FxsA [Corynebacterium suranareeae]|uniref:Phage T7 F exclusion suppressor FxsA n=1 Tax=Corynebacterium suranareeae TaxID=2506452 RepID=A0A160PQR1_9CORY|nr:FxsA family protein [Corynebacterium suranareeae]BAU95835.1 phage T7 F exclusion suppressor FxsA [Corynebacterium suranareeae]
MPAAIAIPYFIIEILAFIGVVMWLGFGWALGLLALFFIGGLLLAGVELRRISKSAAIHQASGQGSPGAIAGNVGLTAAGAILVAMPGFVSSIVGLLLIFAPTRALIRTMLAKRLRRAIENLGVRGFEAVNGYRTQASYGNFGAAFGDTAQQHPKENIVIDEEEIQAWTSDLKPEDFTKPKDESDGEK